MATEGEQTWTQGEFEAALGELVRSAERDGVDVGRALDLDAAGEEYRWMVDISRVRTRNDRSR